MVLDESAESLSVWLRSVLHHDPVLSLSGPVSLKGWITMGQPPTITTGIPYPGPCHTLDSLPFDSFVEEGRKSLAVWLMTGEHRALDLYLPRPTAEKDWIANSGAATLHHHRQPLSRALPDSSVLNLVSESSKKVKNLQLHG